MKTFILVDSASNVLGVVEADRLPEPAAFGPHQGHDGPLHDFLPPRTGLPLMTSRRLDVNLTFLVFSSL